ncbi:winged helix-turn-helix transcriptional regulator [Ensifer sp. 4252]|uniref:winged helix-turn-helix transcriptional regulator n=1 Tax=Ensifer sp. 4252 TaxID=3373915 RepID=UPI003D21A50D
MNGRIVIHTEDAELYLLLKHILTLEGFSTENTNHLSELLSHVHQAPPLAVIVDCSDPDMNASALCARIKAATEPGAKVVSLVNTVNGDHGRPLVPSAADCNIHRPFDPERLLAFLRGLRADVAAQSSTNSATILRYADIEMNLSRLRVERDGHPVLLSALQFRLLLCLMRAPDVVHTRDDLIAAAWPPDAEVEPRTVDIHIGHIRRAMKRTGADVIRTVRSVGYALYLPSH